MEEENDYLTSVPPEPSSAENTSGEISCFPVFQLLDELNLSGRITSTQVAKLKSKYSKFKDILDLTRNNESRLLKYIRCYNDKIEESFSKLENYEDFPDVINTESLQLRKQLLSFRNKTQTTNESLYELEYKIESLDEERKILLREYDRMPKANDLEKIIKNLKKDCDAIETEIIDKQAQIRAVTDGMDKQKTVTAELNSELQSKTNQKENLIMSIVDIKTNTAHVVKDIEKLTRDISNKTEIAEANSKNFDQLMAEIDALKKQITSVDSEKSSLTSAIERQKAIFEAHQQSFSSAQKKIDYNEQEEQEQKDKGQELDQQLKENGAKLTRLTSKIANEEMALIRANKDLKRVSIEIRKARDQRQNLLAIFNRVKENHSLAKQNDGYFDKMRRMIEEECETTRTMISEKNYAVSTEEVKIDNLLNEIEVLLGEENNLKVEVVELARLATINESEREVKAKDLIKSEQRYKQILAENKVKQFELEETRRKTAVIKNKLRVFSKVYETVESERNKCVGLIQTVTQKVLEMRDKMQTMENEHGILRTALSQQQKNLQKLKVKSNASITARDAIRSDIWKLKRTILSLDDTKLEKQTDINRLNKEINNIESKLVDTRRNYQRIVRFRNEKGVTLIERNEELCIFQEKFNLQERIIMEANREMAQLENDINYLNIVNKSELRNLAILHKKQPKKAKLEKQKEILNHQIFATQLQIDKMNVEHENVESDKRVRKIKGSELPSEEILSKHNEMENRVLIKEECLLEKDMILEQIDRFIRETGLTVERSKGSALELSKTINAFKKKIFKKTRKLMATVSELSMNKAKTAIMRQEILEKEVEIDQCYQRMEQSLPPSNEIEVERLKEQERKSRMKRERLEKHYGDLEESRHILPDGTYTTAVQRPNAYIPITGGEIPVPKPFGANAPFIASDKSANMRFYKKPTIKQIEI